MLYERYCLYRVDQYEEFVSTPINDISRPRSLSLEFTKLEPIQWAYDRDYLVRLLPLMEEGNYVILHEYVIKNN